MIDQLFAVSFARQRGLITRAQALEIASVDAIRHRLESGRWVRVGAGVYRLAGVRVTWEQRALAACLIAQPHAVVSHRAAAVLFGVSGFRPGRVEITVPPGRGARNPLARVHRSSVKPRSVRDGVPVTPPARMLSDLSRVVGEQLLEEAVDDVLCRRLVRLDRVEPTTVALATVLAAWQGDGEAQMAVEMRVVRALLAAGLPHPVRQHWILDAHARIDLAYPDARIAIELDSFRWHGGRRPFDSDRARGNRIVAAGWRLLRATPGHEPDTVTAAARLLKRQLTLT
ncbi:MAG: type IV toxin-antitoxin system AbiEi family antitoxin domain-containing protein [Acidimicrobiales bacterium]